MTFYFKKFLLFCLALLPLTGVTLFVLHVPAFRSTPHPAHSYEEALQKFTLIQQRETKLSLSPEGHSRLMVHKTKTNRVFVLLHGLSSCPEQCVPLAKILFTCGANVVIIRARAAGYANTFCEEQNNQSGQDLIDQAAESIDIAAGLGQEITIVSLSAGTLGATWMAEHRDGIDQVLLIAPFFGAYGWSLPALDVATAFLLYFPNFYIWKKDLLHNPSYAYPGYGTQCLAKTLELSRAVRSFQGPLKTKRLDFLISGADNVVNGQLTQKVAQQWSAENLGKVFFHEFPAALGIGHDCIDPNNYNSNTELSYPVILKILHLERFKNDVHAESIYSVLN